LPVLSSSQSPAATKWNRHARAGDYCETVAKVRFHVVLNAKQDKVAGELAGAIKIKLRGPPVEGKANARLRRFLAERLRLAEREIVLEQGTRSNANGMFRIKTLGKCL
jgi:uncharacterized protein YggU (UPF0235/DUF167 family)